MSDERHIRLLVDYKNLAPAVCGLAPRVPYFTVFHDTEAKAWTLVLPPGEHAEAIAAIDGHYIRDYIVT